MNLDRVLQMMQEDRYYATCDKCGYESEVEVDAPTFRCHECEKGRMINPMRDFI